MQYDAGFCGSGLLSNESDGMEKVWEVVETDQAVTDPKEGLEMLPCGRSVGDWRSHPDRAWRIGTNSDDAGPVSAYREESRRIWIKPRH